MSELNVDLINEQTSANGVTIDGVLVKDGQVDGVDVSALNTTVSTDNVETSTPSTKPSLINTPSMVTPLAAVCSFIVSTLSSDIILFPQVLY